MQNLRIMEQFCGYIVCAIWNFVKFYQHCDDDYCSVIGKI